MLPGKAMMEPVPSRFRSSATQKAMAVAYQGPRNTPPMILMTLCIGQHLLKPTGTDRVPPSTPTAVSTPARAILRMTSLCFSL